MPTRSNPIQTLWNADCADLTVVPMSAADRLRGKGIGC
jgi:hypothetical protein